MQEARRKTGLQKKLIIIVIGILLSNNWAFSQNEKFKALFIYNFTRYIEWPARGNGSFKIAVMGSNGLFSELKDIASKMKVDQSPIQVSQVNSSDEIMDCQILFISREHQPELAKIAGRAKAGKMLVISEWDYACLKGASINFITKNGNLNFEISRANLQASGLKVNADLFALGKVVE